MVTTAPGRRDWERPGLQTIAPGVHRIPLPLTDDGLRAVNVYAVEDGDQVVLIDSGPPTSFARERLADGLSQVGMALGDIRLALVTHLHEDHYTQAIALRRDVGSLVALGWDEDRSLQLVRDRTRDTMSAQLELLEVAGAAGLLARLARERPSTDNDVWQWYGEPDTWLDEGLEIELAGRRLQLIHTPGHTRGHIVFHDPETRLLFSGDHVLPHITPSIGYEALVPPQPLRDYLNSLAKVRLLPDAALLPGHGPVSGSVHARVDALLHHHDVRLQAVGAVVDALGQATAADIAERLRWTRHDRKLADLNAMNQLLAVLETKSHADLLVLQGRLITKQDGQVVCYLPPATG